MQEREKYNLDTLDPLIFLYAFLYFGSLLFLWGRGNPVPIIESLLGSKPCFIPSFPLCKIEI